MDINVQVAVRCRPMSSKEINRGCINVITIGQTASSSVPNTVHVKGVPGTGTGNSGGGEDRDFTFDYCYGADSTQFQVYSDLGQVAGNIVVIFFFQNNLKPFNTANRYQSTGWFQWHHICLWANRICFFHII